MKEYVRPLAALMPLAAIVVFAAHPVVAQQAPGSPGAPGVRSERPDPRLPAAKSAEDFDPKGIRMGSFLLFPTLELDEVYNNNIYATNFGDNGRTASFVQLIKPGVELRSDWQSHMLNFFARGNVGIFSATPTPNFTDGSTGFDGRFDIQRDWNVYGGASFNHNHEDPGTPNAATGAVPPNTYDQISGNAGYYQKFNRFSVRADGRLDNYNYTNNLVSTGGSLPGFYRDRAETRESLRLGYQLGGDSQVWTRGSLNQRNYKYTPDSSGFNRNSSGFDIVGGLQLDFGGITSVEVFAGFLQQDYVDSNFKQVMQPTFGLTGFWNPIRELSVRPFVSRTVSDAGLANAAAYLSTAGGLDVDYKIRPNIKISGFGSYSVADYSVVSRTSTEYDQYLTVRGSVIYSLDNVFFIGPSVQYTYKTSNLPSANYDQIIAMLRLGAHW